MYSDEEGVYFSQVRMCLYIKKDGNKLEHEKLTDDVTFQKTETIFYR